MSGCFSFTSLASSCHTAVSSGEADHIDQRRSPEASPPPPPQAPAPSRPTPASPRPPSLRKSRRSIVLPVSAPANGPTAPTLTLCSPPILLPSPVPSPRFSSRTHPRENTARLTT